ncbi:MAG: hypothetical protein GY699_04030 [Desulfobacteraceae bacterium]|nr:hypothetical protein [Desulfobacteraceae bacterium]
MKTYPSAALLRNLEVLMYSSTLRFQDPLRLAYGQLFIQTRFYVSHYLDYWRNDAV